MVSHGGSVQTTFSQLPINTPFIVTDTWQRDDLEVDKVYFKIDDRQARLAAKVGDGYQASHMPRIIFAASHPVNQIT